MSQKPTVVFRCDASTAIGGGHVVRSMALAIAFAQSGWGIGFAVASGTIDVVPALDRQGWHVETNLDFHDSGATALSRHWPDGVALAVVDSYKLAELDESALRPWAERLLVIDDLANRRHDCDFLVDQTLGRGAADYAALVPSGTRLLCGASYALLRPEFNAARPAALNRRAEAATAQRILVSVGATDVDGVTLNAVRAVREACPLADIDVVVGGLAQSLAALQSLSASDPRLHVHVDTAEMARLMASADLAVGAAGSSAWERCCLGLPSILLVLADNQRGVASALDAAGAAVVIETGRDLPQRLVGAISHLARDHEGRRRMAAQAATVADGFGAQRVVAEVTTVTDRGGR